MNVAEPTTTSIWALVSSWSTPTIFFCLLNLTIGTIFITSSLKTHHKKQELAGEDHLNQPQLARVPSILQRVKSINFSNFYRSDQTYPSPPVNHYDYTQEVHDSKVEEAEVQCEISETEHHMTENNSENCAEAPANGPVRRMEKSVSEKVLMLEKHEVDRRRPATVRERKGRRSETEKFGEDEAVDEKADDFINRFRQQLKLQRVDSNLRYKEMINRGAG